MPVAPNTQPIFDERPSTSRNVDENTSPGEDIGEPVAATDPENNTLTYSLDVSIDADSFSIDASSGQLRTRAALDYETGPNSYIVTVDATDPSGLYDTIEVTITVNNVDEPGTVTLSSLQPQVSFQLTATLDDPDNVRGSATWSWASSPNGSSSWTPISGETSATYTPVAADVGDYLRATASYTDGEGSGKSAEGVSANVVQAAPVPQNLPPEFSSNTAARDVDENTSHRRARHGHRPQQRHPDLLPGRQQPGLLQHGRHYGPVADQSRSELRNWDPVQLHRDRNRHGPGRPGRHYRGHHHVNNVDEPGTVTLSSLQPIEGTPLTATLDDPDDVSGSATWLWAGSPNGSSSWTPISGETSATYTPVTADVDRFLRATASYTDGEGSGKSAQVVSTNRVLPVPVAPNGPPQFPSNTAARDVDENTVAGQEHRRSRLPGRPPTPRQRLP